MVNIQRLELRCVLEVRHALGADAIEPVQVQPFQRPTARKQAQPFVAHVMRVQPERLERGQGRQVDHRPIRKRALGAQTHVPQTIEARQDLEPVVGHARIAIQFETLQRLQSAQESQPIVGQPVSRHVQDPQRRHLRDLRHPLVGQPIRRVEAFDVRQLCQSGKTPGSDTDAAEADPSQPPQSCQRLDQVIGDGDGLDAEELQPVEVVGAERLDGRQIALGRHANPSDAQNHPLPRRDLHLALRTTGVLHLRIAVPWVKALDDLRHDEVLVLEVHHPDRLLARKVQRPRRHRRTRGLTPLIAPNHARPNRSRRVARFVLPALPNRVSCRRPIRDSARQRPTRFRYRCRGDSYGLFDLRRRVHNRRACCLASAGAGVHTDRHRNLRSARGSQVHVRAERNDGRHDCEDGDLGHPRLRSGARRLRRPHHRHLAQPLQRGRGDRLRGALRQQRHHRPRRHQQPLPPQRAPQLRQSRVDPPAHRRLGPAMLPRDLRRTLAQHETL